MTAPVLYRPASGRLQLRAPYRPRARRWLRLACGPGTRPEWNADVRVWEIARSHFARLLDSLFVEHSAVRVIVEGYARERCDSRCRNARGDDCTCSCVGRYHKYGATDGEGWWSPDGLTLVRGEFVTYSTVVLSLEGVRALSGRRIDEPDDLVDGGPEPDQLDAVRVALNAYDADYHSRPVPTEHEETCL